MERPIYIQVFPWECCKCGRELPKGTTCYDLDGDILCESCMDKYLEDLKEECETEAETAEQWS